MTLARLERPWFKYFSRGMEEGLNEIKRGGSTKWKD